MKIFLFVSGLAMLSAGIVGVADFATDLINGTLIEYDEQDVPSTKQTVATEKKSVKILPSKKIKNGTPTATKIVTVETIVKEKKEKKLNMKMYSRGDPNVYDEELIEVPDSTTQANP